MARAARTLRQGVGSGRLIAILHASLFANHALPVKAGELLRPVLGARAGIPIADATVSTAVARLLDIAALLAIAAALLPLTAGGEGVAVLAVPALLLAAIAGALLWFRRSLDTPRGVGPALDTRARRAPCAPAARRPARLRPHRAELAA